VVLLINVAESSRSVRKMKVSLMQRAMMMMTLQTVMLKRLYGLLRTCIFYRHRAVGSYGVRQPSSGRLWPRSAFAAAFFLSDHLLLSK